MKKSLKSTELVFIKVFIQTKIFCFRLNFMCLINVLINICKMTTPHEKAHVYPGLLRQNWMFRLSKNTELSMEEIDHQVLQFIDGTRNL